MVGQQGGVSKPFFANAQGLGGPVGKSALGEGAGCMGEGFNTKSLYMQILNPYTHKHKISLHTVNFFHSDSSLYPNTSLDIGLYKNKIVGDYGDRHIYYATRQEET